MITGIQKVRIAAQIGRSVRTVGRVYLGQGNNYSRDAVRLAAAALGYPLPPEPLASSSPSSPEPSPTSSNRAA
jgi:hypothetical protein